MKKPQTIIFDLGGVLIDYDPRYLYRKVFSTEEEINWFLEHVCTPEWNEQQDAGRSFADAIKKRVAQFPEYEEPIRIWFRRWPETIRGPIQETVDVLKAIRDSKEHEW